MVQLESVKTMWLMSGMGTEMLMHWVGYLVTVKTLIRRLQERTLDQRQECSHQWRQQMQFQRAENLRNPDPQMEV